MKSFKLIWRVGLAIVLCGAAAVPVYADNVPVAPALVIREIKITGDEFVVLQAMSDIPDLSAYWIGYNSTDAGEAGTIVPTQQLPAYKLKS